MHFLPFLLFIISFSLPSPSFSTVNSSGIEWWCNTTPHPQSCLYYLTHRPHHDPPKHKSDFYKLSVEVAFDLALHAQTRLVRLGKKCGDERQKKAWIDCWKLYGNTVLQLNRTLHPPGGCTNLDSQTWLSAALTNLHTCRKGFIELGASMDVIKPVEKYNISQIVSNCLAINKPWTQSNQSSKGHFPSWTTVGGRKLLQLSVRANLVVAKDGSGNFMTIKAALDAASAQMQNSRNGRFVIYVKAGVYDEIVKVPSSMSDLTMVGDGIGKTIITGSLSVAQGSTTFSSATFSVFGDGFIATGITFRNTFGTGSQAVALLTGSDQSLFYRCSIEGYQDSLCVYTQRQFYRECDIYGTIDFIFGNAAAVLQNCNIYSRRPQRGEATVVTAQGRTDQNQNTGIVIQFSTIKAAPDLWVVHQTVSSYLGRPWMQYSRTVYLQNYIDSSINSAGWLEFNGNFALDTLFYAEFRNKGPGSRMSRRVKWPGYHVIVRPSKVRQFTVANFIAGGAWIPPTGVPFSSGL